MEKLGPATFDLIRTWLNDSKVKIQPVLDLDRTDAVDVHDPPPWMREQVILRDQHCVFPWCGRDARSTEVAGELVASALGTLEIGVPHPMSPTGRAVRLANVITLSAHRGRGPATELIRDVVAWGQGSGVDRIEMNATPERIYERLASRSRLPRA